MGHFNKTYRTLQLIVRTYRTLQMSDRTIRLLTYKFPQGIIVREWKSLPFREALGELS